MDPPSLASSMRNRFSQNRRVDACTQTENTVEPTLMKTSTHSLISGGYSSSINLLNPQGTRTGSYYPPLILRVHRDEKRQN
ncbi:unnamed protein product [Nippostrongylus brasiliensis]|uniref:Uncharacterized protein n=1 Tax=Nippostrongylus brasiliensis TaxID=27835 RepID=A0A0N4Y2Z4_NIPBR|nr:unnamed protein product [Nippostrongylus brasiliensis]